ncbi:hypothetical protein HDU98_000384, partial [Podochytrium sp. JEL0797]
MVVIWSFITTVSYFILMALLLLGSEANVDLQPDQYVDVWKSRLSFAIGTSGLVDEDVLRDVSARLARYFR